MVPFFLKVLGQLQIGMGSCTVADMSTSYDYLSSTECGMGLGDSGCGTRRTFTSECGAIDVKKGPDINTACEWLIDVPEGKLVNLTFHDFTIEDTGMGSQHSLGRTNHIISLHYNSCS